MGGGVGGGVGGVGGVVVLRGRGLNSFCKCKCMYV